MSWLTLPEDVRHTAERVLTAKQLEAWKLYLDGHSHRRIAFELDLSRGATMDRLEAADRALRKHGIHQTADGSYSQPNPDAA